MRTDIPYWTSLSVFKAISVLDVTRSPIGPLQILGFMLSLLFESPVIVPKVQIPKSYHECCRELHLLLEE